MSEAQLESLLAKVAELKSGIASIPESTANGQLIDAAGHIKNAEYHLERYYAMSKVKTKSDIERINPRI